MKILFLSVRVNINKYNAEYIHTFSLAKNLVLLKNDVKLIIGGNEKKHIIKDNIKIFISEFNFTGGRISIITRLYKYILNSINLIIYILGIKNIKEVEVIYERFYPGVFHGLFLSFILRKPLFYEQNSVSDEELFIDSKINNKILKYFISMICKLQLSYANKVIVQSAELKNITESKFKITNVSIVENGVDNRSNIYNSKNDSVSLIYSGSIDMLHNPELLFMEIHNSKLKVIINIISKGKLFEKLKTTLKDDNRFNFVDRLTHEEVLNFIAKSDIGLAMYDPNFVLYKKYGFYLCPLKILEYASFGKPIIVYGIENHLLKELQQANGAYVVNNIIDYRETLINLIKNKRNIKVMGENAKKFSNNYTWKNSALKTLKVLKEK